VDWDARLSGRVLAGEPLGDDRHGNEDALRRVRNAPSFRGAITWIQGIADFEQKHGWQESGREAKQCRLSEVVASDARPGAAARMRTARRTPAGRRTKWTRCGKQSRRASPT
jgi:hypothetical protein